MTRYVLHLTPIPDRLGREPAIRLKQLLKLALRVCGFRCTKIENITQPTDPGEIVKANSSTHSVRE